MAQHTKIQYPTHNYHKSSGITDPVDQEIKFNALALKKILSNNAVRLQMGHLQVTAEFLISWSDYGDIWFTMDNFHEVDQVVTGLPFEQSFAFFDTSANYIIILYSKVLNSYRVIMSGTKEVPGTLRASMYPHNGFFTLEEYCDFDDRLSISYAEDGQNITVQAFLNSEFTEIYENAESKSRGFYIHNLETQVIEREVSENLSISIPKVNCCISAYVSIGDQEYRSDVLTYLNS